MLSRVSASAILTAVILAAPALAADAPTICRDSDQDHAVRATACAEAAEGAATTAVLSEFLDLQARSLRRLERLDEAEALVREARELAPMDPDPIATMGHLLHDRGDYVGAQVLLDQALSMEPDRPRFLLAAMWNLPEVGELQRCFDLAPQAFAVAPEDGRTHAYLARCELEAGWDAEAVQDYRRALELGLDESWVRGSLSIALFHLGFYPEALIEAHRAVDLDPSSEGARISLMNALARTGAPEKALALYEETQALGIADTEGQAEHLAWNLYRAGHPDLALPVVEAWRRDHRNVPRVEDTYAHVLAALGRPEEAAQAFETAIALTGPELDGYYAYRLGLLGFSLRNGLGAALRACTATGVACRLND
jgi:tetratricopeptide (TPR) repeat protein